MKILLYTITDCQFSKQEKEYLQSHNLPFEEKNLETNREFLTEMLAVSNNFAGTPVTKIEKDDGQIVVLKGFTKEDFDKTLGFATAEKDKPAPTAQTATPPVAPVVPQEAPVQQPTPEPSAPKAADPMANILDNLAQQAQTPPTPAAAAPSPLPPQNGMPTIPDPQL